MKGTVATRADMLAVKADIERLGAKFDAKFDKLQWMLGIINCFSQAP